MGAAVASRVRRQRPVLEACPRGGEIGAAAVEATPEGKGAKGVAGGISHVHVVVRPQAPQARSPCGPRASAPVQRLPCACAGKLSGLRSSSESSRAREGDEREGPDEDGDEGEAARGERADGDEDRLMDATLPRRCAEGRSQQQGKGGWAAVPNVSRVQSVF